MNTEIKSGERVYSLRLQEIVIVKTVFSNSGYALVEDEQGTTYTVSVSTLETMEEHIENRLRLD